MKKVICTNNTEYFKKGDIVDYCSCSGYTVDNPDKDGDIKVKLSLSDEDDPGHWVSAEHFEEVDADSPQDFVSLDTDGKLKVGASGDICLSEATIEVGPPISPISTVFPVVIRYEGRDYQLIENSNDTD